MRYAFSAKGDLGARSLPSYAYLQDLMSRYRTDALVGVDARSFRTRIEQFLQLEDSDMEGFASPEMQRDQSVTFHWGHDHDFGDFSLRGSMGDRHISLLATYIDRFQALPRDLDGMRVLDVGCWTGGTSLLLAAMGARVVAIEEVKKYVDCLDYLKQSFGVDGIEPRNLSLYDCTAPELQDSFDFVLFAGVLYHVTDPVLALRLTFNCLRDAGVCLIETAATESRQPILVYEGPTVFAESDGSGKARTGWNWFVPSPSTLAHMMAHVGYAEVQLSKIINTRVFATGKRMAHVDIMRGGLSARHVR